MKPLATSAPYTPENAVVDYLGACGPTDVRTLVNEVLDQVPGIRDFQEALKSVQDVVQQGRVAHYCKTYFDDGTKPYAKTVDAGPAMDCPTCGPQEPSEPTDDGFEEVCACHDVLVCPGDVD